ncbi:hypothetical protein D3C71_1125930 [compost metagenome]
MRSTQKKGPRTPALIRAKSRGGIAARVYEVLQGAQSVAAMSSASLAAIRVSQVINAKWAEAIKLGNLSDGAHGAAADAIARAAGFREPPEPEPTTQIVPKQPLCPAGGAMRSISVTVLPDGGTRIDIGDQVLRLNAKEADALCWCFSSSCSRRGCE